MERDEQQDFDDKDYPAEPWDNEYEEFIEWLMTETDLEVPYE